jgi:hypothetical protein
VSSKKGGKNKGAHKKPKNKSNNVDDEARQQHSEWVQFQRSIVVPGFETGQVTDASGSSDSKRGGKARRSKEAKRNSELETRIAERRRFTDIAGGEFPPLRYNEEETERLLQEAYAAIPPRAGYRGSRNLKRQRNRFRLVKQIRAKYKYQLAAAQERKMEKRSLKVQQVRAVLESAPDAVTSDRLYQLQVLQRWKATMAANKETVKLIDKIGGAS